LGATWAIVRPLLTMAVFAVVFGRFAKLPSDGHPYPLFVFVGLLPWMFFADALNRASGSLVGSAHLVSKVYFPRLIIPMAVIGTSFLDFLVASGILGVLLLHYGVALTWNLLAIPFLAVALVLIAFGFGSFFGALAVAYRDFAPLTAFLVQIWMYVTPVVYPASLFPESVRWLLYLNPITGIIEGFRVAVLGGAFPVAGLVASGLIALGALILGVVYFEKVERRFADVI
jgi:lipopolysaccharide transport system permease protein